jgi:thiol-disulfide isomerase/thioredoxin
VRSLRRLILIVLAAAPVRAATVNAPAPAFELETLHHSKRALADYRGHVVLINFWASWCAPCQAELPALDRVASEMPQARVKVLAVNVDEDRAAAEKLLSRLGLDRRAAIDVLWDSRSKVVSAYDIEAMPSSFILDRKGIVRYAHAGFHAGDAALWRQEIRHLLSTPK